MSAMTPEERAVIKAAQKFVRRETPERRTDLAVAVQRLKISRQPLHTVEPIPCMVYANHSATMFCILPKGHEGSVPEMIRGTRFEGPTYHTGLAAGRPGSPMARRGFKHWASEDTMEQHPRAACARFPGCTRHPKREIE